MVTVLIVSLLRGFGGVLDLKGPTMVVLGQYRCP